MASSAVLYTPEILALATGLSRFSWNETLQWHGEARSQTCGSTLRLGLACDADGRIAQVGVRAHACAIGQAAATLFAQGAQGADRARIATSEAAMVRWLAGTGSMPDWPDIAALDAARAYPARHGAILLAWRAALAALPSGENPG